LLLAHNVPLLNGVGALKRRKVKNGTGQTQRLFDALECYSHLIAAAGRFGFLLSLFA
jgi:hypothetical protein